MEAFHMNLTPERGEKGRRNALASHRGPRLGGWRKWDVETQPKPAKGARPPTGFKDLKGGTP
jgi:hypothetical protein